MTELVLVFFLGMLIAGLIWLLALPAFWRRAVRLTRARIERAMPLSPNEIRAESDRLRARHAVEIARAGQSLDAARAELVAAKAELGARFPIEADLISSNEAARHEIAQLGQKIEALEAELAARDHALAELADALTLARASITGLETQRDALAAQRDSVAETAEKRRLALDKAQVLADRAREALAEETLRNADLRQQLAQRQHDLRDAERRLEDGEHRARLALIRGGEETYQSAVPSEAPRKAG
jgi:predicted  nucleic acid-binding Zn-ribbon protein